MSEIIKHIEKLGAGAELTHDELNQLSIEEKALLEAGNLEAIKKLLNAPTNIVCGVLPAEDDDDKEENDDDKQDSPDKEEKSA